MDVDVKPKELQKAFTSLSLGAPDRAIGFVLWKMFHLYQREIDRALEALELTHLQFTTLTLVAWLSKDGDEVTQTTLARFSDIHKVQLSQMLKALDEKGMVTRKTSSIDVRAKNVTVTQVGLARMRKALPLVIAVQKRLFGETGMPDGKLLKTFHSVLRHMESEASVEA
ncbi:MarR family winged helix-turn-helix transcriptional regulator [Paraburkholderia acidisoli]|uniref:Winged helix DNA-binding protein n=1 Tax=Paraburkholderia acidisoli TaxID=2571748 RepID=A0A7Z2GPH8_9BURK|nr:MarR family winged helix-turn-helix transcriptional regulator [Paraburkholderia acidisoli]QGZ65550.1 winged helix DNA-binding protein [Paraburkholderia acidisoli]